MIGEDFRARAYENYEVIQALNRFIEGLEKKLIKKEREAIRMRLQAQANEQKIILRVEELQE